MPFFRPLTIACLLVTLVSCSRDPQTAKKRYLESGNTYFDKGLYKPAMIQYRNAIKIDPKFGPAYYRLGTLFLKLTPPQTTMAYEQYRRAAELLKGNEAYQEEYKKTIIQLAEMQLAYLWTNKQAMESVQSYCDQLFKKDPNSFDGYRLTGDLNVRRSQLPETAPADVAALLDKAMENYRKADGIKSGDPAISMQIGMILKLQKHYAEAEPYIRNVINKDKTSANAYDALYRLYIVEGKTTEAEQLLKEGVQNNPKSPEFLERLATHYGATGRRDDMLSVLEQIKARAKDFDSAYQVVGSFYLRLGDAESALRSYREGIVKDPKHKSAYQHSIIEVLMRQGKRAEAAEVNAQILKENPKDADAKSLAATFLLDRGDVATALAQLQALVTSSPDNAAARYQLGRAYLASGRQDGPEMARQQFERASQLRPDMLNPKLGLAELQVMRGQYEAALDTLQDVLSRDPGNVNAKLIQAQAYLGQKKFGDSDNVMASMARSNPNSPDVFYQQGVSALAQNRLEDAKSAFMRAYELNPANARGLLGVIDADLKEGKPDAAMTLLQAESKKSPNRIDIILLEGTTAKKQGRYPEALSYFNQVLNGLDKKSKTRADLYMQIGDTYLQQGDRENSIASYLKAKEILPENPLVLAFLGVVLDGAGRKADARQAYEASLKISPNNAYVLNNLAYIMAESNSDLDIALNYAQKAKGLEPNRAEISDTLGWIMLKKSLYEQAIPVFKDLTNRFPTTSTYHYHLALAYKQKSDNPHALEELREALKHSPVPAEQQQIHDTMASLGAKL